MNSEENPAKMTATKVYADFHNADAQGRLRLNCVGTLEDLSRQKIELRDGLRLTLYADDVNAHGDLDELQADGVVSFSNAEHCWVATIDWSAIQHASENAKTIAAVAGPPQSMPPVDKA